MASEFGESDFVDKDFEAAQRSPYAAPANAGDPAGTSRPPTREELDSRVGETQEQLARLKRQQEDLERQRAALEEERRRQIEFQTGREEMLQHLTRGLGLLEEAEFATRRDSEQMTKSISDLRDALAKVQSINDAAWTKEDYNLELTRALTTLENARMEWNGARLKWPVLDGAMTPKEGESGGPGKIPNPLLATQSFGQLCRLGFALTWPVALVALLILIALLVRR